MPESPTPVEVPPPARGATHQPTLHRSGAVARMLQMPVATLRVWERRYGLSQAARSASGQRLYSADEVRRLALLKQLTDRGHAIGRLAALSMAELQQVASTHATVLAGHQPAAAASPPAARPWRVVVVGAGLHARLQQAGMPRRLQAGVDWLGPYADASQAAAALAAQAPADAWLLHAPRLQPGWLDELQAAVPSLCVPFDAQRQAPVAVLFHFAADATCEALAQAGVHLLREPQPDVVLGPWLEGWLAAGAARGAGPSTGFLAGAGAGGLPFDAHVPAPRWNDAALAEFAGLSTTIACECPRHVAELLMQLSHFEAYSAECAHRSPGDAELHGYLRQVAATSRARFETALEQVAVREGLLLPADCPGGTEDGTTTRAAPAR